MSAPARIRFALVLGAALINIVIAVAQPHQQSSSQSGDASATQPLDKLIEQNQQLVKQNQAIVNPNQQLGKQNDRMAVFS